MDDPLIPPTQTGQSPATQEDNLSTRYGTLDKDAEEEQRQKDQRRALNDRDIKRMKDELQTLREHVTTEQGQELYESVRRRHGEKQETRGC